MNTRNLKWMLGVIERLLILEVGDPHRLESIQFKLKNSKIISEEDDQYISEKIKDLRKLEPVSTPSETNKSNFSIGKVIGISALVIIVIGGAYFWINEISPEIQRVNQLPKEEPFNPAEHWGYECTTYSTADHDCFGVPYGP